MPPATNVVYKSCPVRVVLTGVCAAACAVAVVVGACVTPRDGFAASAATCTFEQKQARTAELARQAAKLAAERAAFFKRHKAKTQRAAFLKRQQKKLRALRAAAACSVPPVPPSSDESCSFMLAKNADAARAELPFGTAFLNEGPIAAGGSLRSIGHVNALVLMVDFPDAPSSGPPSISEAYAPDPKYFEEVSYGRFTLSVSFGDRWVRMPNPTSAYAGRLVGAPQRDYVQDAVTAADPFVDFSRYQFIFIVPTIRWGGINIAYHNFPGHGARSAEGEIRFGALLTGDISRFGPGAARVADHEFIHTLGIPDIYDDPTVGTWDPEAAALNGGPPPGTHMLGWHKWRLGWLDPTQLTCLSAPGQIEETLTPIATSGGKKLVVVPTSPSTAYVIEGRRRIGYDSGICEEGVLVYDADSQIGNGETRGGRGVINMKGPRRCPGPAAAPSGGALHTGEAYEDASVKVEVLARDANAFRVRVTKK
jgi:M6 family metalloprotease-like protein